MERSCSHLGPTQSRISPSMLEGTNTKRQRSPLEFLPCVKTFHLYHETFQHKPWLLKLGFLTWGDSDGEGASRDVRRAA